MPFYHSHSLNDLCPIGYLYDVIKIFTIARPENAPDRLKKFNLVGIMDGEVMYEAKINLTTKSKASATIPKMSLVPGSFS